MEHIRYAVKNENGFIKLEGKHFYDEVDFEKADLFLSKERAEKLSSSYNKAWVVEVIVGEEEVDEQEKVVVPKFVADWIVDLKSKKINLLESIYDFTHGEDIHDYIREQGNALMRAWLDGYEVEKKPKYYVQLKVRSLFGTVGVFLYKQGDEVLAGDNFRAYHPEKDEFRLTEQEIKDYDERFWSFAVPVEEVQSD